jgi:prepilin-type N-terminal cleavage/methylation domain-containing protein
MNRRAFTLLELILVMAIIAIVVGMAIPRLLGFAKGRQTSQCADQIVALTRYARTQAITKGVPYRMNLDPANGTYWLTVQQDDGFFGQSGNSFGSQFRAPDGTRLNWNAPVQQDGQYIQFQPNGRADPAEIQVLSSDGQTIVIGCLSATEIYKILTPDEQRLIQQQPQQQVTRTQ